MASQDDSNMSQNPLTQKQIMQFLFRDEIPNPTEDSSFEGSQEEINIFNEVFLRDDPSILEQSRLKLKNNMAMRRIVESSGRGISCYNICCILSDQKEISHDKTGSGAGKKEVSHDKTCRSIGTGTEEVSDHKISTNAGTKEVSHMKTGTITGMKEISHDQTGTSMKEVFQDETGIRNGKCAEEVFQYKAGTSTSTSMKEVSHDKTGSSTRSTGTGTEEVSNDKINTITSKKGGFHDKDDTIAGVKEVSRDKVGNSNGAGKNEVFQDRAGTSTGGTGTKEVSQDKTGIVLALITNKRDESGMSKILPVSPNPISYQKEPKMLNPVGTKLESIGTGLTEETNRPVPVLNTGISSPTVDRNPTKKTRDFSKRGLKDLCTNLRSNVNRLLADSGYKLEIRKIKRTNCSNYYYHLPNNKGVLQNLPKTWASLGNLLNSDHTDTAGKQWVGIEDFESDLQNTLIFLENKMKTSTSELSLLERWFLLDPFVAVTFIDQKIGALRDGAKIRAINSKTCIVSEKEIMDLKNKNVNTCHLPLVISQPRSRYGESKNAVNLQENEVPTGSKFAITQLSQDTVFQKPFLSQNSIFQKPVLSQNIIFQKPTLSPDSAFRKPILSPDSVFQKPVSSPNSVFQKPILSQNSVFQKPILSPNSVFQKPIDQNTIFQKPVSSLNSAFGKPILSQTVFQEPVLSQKTIVQEPIPSLKDLCTHLRATANCLLADSGYKLEFRKRKDGNCLRTSYRLPNYGPLLRNLPKSWISLGTFLNSDRRSAAGKQWVGIEEYKSDMRTTLLFIENMKNNNSELSLLERWFLLDPFVAVSFIDQKIGALKKGVKIRAINSKTSVVCENDTMDLQNKNVNICENKNVNKNELPIGSKFSINQVKQISGTQKPVLILFPADVQLSLDGEGQITVIKKGNEISVYEPSFFQGTLAFDETSGFEMKESFVNWAVYNPVKCKQKKKRKLNSDSKNNRPQKKLKEITDTCQRKRVCPFNTQDLLVSAIIMKRASKYLKMTKMSTFNNQTVKRTSKKKRFSKGPRTILKLLINRGLVSVHAKMFYQNSKKLVKGGKLTRKGILCDCCNKLFSVSGFKLKHHTDFQENLGLMNLFVGFGKPYVICLFKAWELEYKEMRGKVMKASEREIERNDNACNLCADVGELVCCDSCPASFHESCLPDENIPEESWNCPRCKCDICGDFVGKSMENSSSNGFLECFQCGNKYHEKCRKDKRVVLTENDPSEIWFCGNACNQVYKYMRSQIGKSVPINNGFYVATLRCDHEETKKTLNSEELARLAENNMKLVVACSLMKECFDKIVDSRIDIDLVPLVLYNWRVENVNLDCTGFYTVVLEKDDRIISVASIRLHGTKAAEMPLIATCIENRKQGMCRRLVSTIQQMLKSLNVETLLISKLPNLVETWISHFGFVPVEETDKEMLCKLNLLTIPNTVLLKKNLHQVPDEYQGEGCSYLSCDEQLKEVGSQEVENSPEPTMN